MSKFQIPAELQKRLMGRRGRLHAYNSFDGPSTAFVIVDMQNFFMKDGELMCAPGARDIVPTVNRLAQAVRSVGGQVIWIVMEASEESREAWHNFHELFHTEAAGRRFKSLGTQGEGYKLWPEMAVDPADLTVYEGVPSATVARALIDCRDMIMHDRLLDAVCTAKRTGLLHAREVQRVLDAIDHDG